MCRLIMLTIIAMMSSPCHLQAVEYDINMSRRAKAGDRYHIECTGNDAARYVWTIDGSVHPAKQRSRRCKLSADAETMVAGAGGSEVQIRLVVNTLTYQLYDDEEKSIPAGSIIEAKWGEDKPVYLLNEKPAEETLARALRFIFVPEPPAYSYDERFAGTTTKQKVGGKWQINSEPLAEHLTNLTKVEIKAENISGFTTLTEATDTELKLVTECTAVNLPANFEPWLTVTDSKMQYYNIVFAPIDLQQRPRKKTNRRTMSATGTGEKDGKQHRLDMAYRFISDYIITPLPSEPSR